MAEWKFTREYHGAVDAKKGEVKELREGDAEYLLRMFPGLIVAAQFVEEAPPRRAFHGGGNKAIRPGWGADK